MLAPHVGSFGAPSENNSEKEKQERFILLRHFSTCLHVFQKSKYLDGNRQYGSLILGSGLMEVLLAG